MNNFKLHIALDGNLEATLGDIKLTEPKVRMAAMRALNRTALYLRSEASRELAKEKQLPLTLIRNRLQMVKANRTTLTAYVLAALSGVKAGKVGKMRQTTSGAKVGSHHFAGAFVATMPSGHAGIFKRKTRKRLPIEEVMISLEPEASQIVQAVLEQKAALLLKERFEHELRYLMK